MVCETLVCELCNAEPAEFAIVVERYTQGKPVWRTHICRECPDNLLSEIIMAQNTLIRGK